MSSQPSKEICAIVDRRDERRCLIDGKNPDWSGGSRHHRRPRSHGFTKLNSPSNLMFLEGSGTTGCHGQIHAHPGLAYRYGWLIHSWVDEPSEVPCKTRDGWMWLLDDGTREPLTEAEKDEWFLATGLKWRRLGIAIHTGKMCTVTLGTGFVDHGKLTKVREDSAGVVVVTLDGSQPWRLENNATIEFEERENRNER